MVYKVGDLSKIIQSASSGRGEDESSSSQDVLKLHNMFDVKKVQTTATPQKKVNVKNSKGQKKAKHSRKGAEFRVLKKKAKSDTKTEGSDGVEKEEVKKEMISKTTERSCADTSGTGKSEKQVDKKTGRKTDNSLVSSGNISPQKMKVKMKGGIKKKHKQTEEVSQHTPGFSPPPGMVHESLMTKAKKRKVGDESGDEEASAADPGLEAKKAKLTRKRRDRLAKDQDDTTIFVGNLPLSVKKKKLQQLFQHYGEIEAIRYRCLPPNDPSVPKRVIAIKKEFHPDRHNCVAFVRFTDAEAARSALSCNGRELDGLHIRVDMAAKDEVKDVRKSVFVGNIPYDIEEEALRKHFEDCGTVIDVRIIREKKTGLGKGFCYIKFSDTDAVAFALRLNGSRFHSREIRVMQCQDNPRKSSLETKDKRSAAGKPSRKRAASNTVANPFQGEMARTKSQAAKEKQQRLKQKGTTKPKFFNDKSGDNEKSEATDSRKRKMGDNIKGGTTKFVKTNEGAKKVNKSANYGSARPTNKPTLTVKSVHTDKFTKHSPRTRDFPGNKDKHPTGNQRTFVNKSGGKGSDSRNSFGGNKSKQFDRAGNFSKSQKPTFQKRAISKNSSNTKKHIIFD